MPRPSPTTDNPLRHQLARSRTISAAEAHRHLQLSVALVGLLALATAVVLVAGAPMGPLPKSAAIISR
jgi:hypothetical protein